MEESSSKFQAQIDIKPSLPRPSSDFPDYSQKVPFFKSGSHRLRGDTWLISVFVLLQIVAFVATMIVNDCCRNSHSDCTFKALGRVSFQPLHENPLLGPSASTLDKMGALRQAFLVEYHQYWRLLTCAGLHAGIIHLIVNLCSVVYIGIHLEQEFGSLRIGIIYILSAFASSLTAALFVQDSPQVSSSGALFGLLGAMLSGLIQNWRCYTKKFAALAMIFLFASINFIIGWLPYVSNFSNIGGFVSGFILGYVVLFSPQINQTGQNKGLLDCSTKVPVKLKQKLDRPVLRTVTFLLFGVLLCGCLVAVLLGVNIRKYISWFRYVDCIPSRMWSCNDIRSFCEVRVSSSEMTTLTCMANGNFRTFPYDISPARIEDLCSLICAWKVGNSGG